jgi:hypothetical protein
MSQSWPQPVGFNAMNASPILFGRNEPARRPSVDQAEAIDYQLTASFVALHRERDSGHTANQVADAVRQQRSAVDHHCRGARGAAFSTSVASRPMSRCGSFGYRKRSAGFRRNRI